MGINMILRTVFLMFMDFFKSQFARIEGQSVSKTTGTLVVVTGIPREQA